MFFDIYNFFFNVLGGDSTAGSYDLVVEFFTVVTSSAFGLFAILLIPAIVWLIIKFIISCVRF